MNSSYCLNMSLCNNHENNDTNISFYNILLNACAKGTCYIEKLNFQQKKAGARASVPPINPPLNSPEEEYQGLG